jgi:CRP-like cAMP-binding protein
LTGFPRTATVRTLTVCTCISLERGQFNRLLNHHPEIRERLSEVALERLQQSARAATD